MSLIFFPFLPQWQLCLRMGNPGPGTLREVGRRRRSARGRRQHNLTKRRLVAGSGQTAEDDPGVAQLRPRISILPRTTTQHADRLHCGAYAFTLLYNDVKSLFDGYKAKRYSIVKRYRELSNPMLEGMPNKKQILFDAVIMLANMADTVAVWLQLLGKQAVLDIELTIKVQYVASDAATETEPPPIPGEVFQRNPTQADVK
ncbi:hypothetical protein BV898_04018 [Hypsibius exemplaris]|uniref:Uncharacterized protein n=1 Tax=Hypsibius exemplaris TaxID=2072580 RepID=A0A1W0X425_HYPEX|nr:hypothetical protein BV898_04018 [Hypsibius exemplaris]